MLKHLKYPPSGEYRTGSDNEPIDFFLSSLSVSNRFDLLLGYFSSSALNVLAIGFAHFIYQGGTVRMVINHILSEKDKKAIIQGQTNPASAFSFSLHDYQQIKTALNEYGEHFFRCLAWLIAAKKIEIVVIRPKTKGIAHYKSGVFYDGEEQLKFKSSCNFTAYGLLENLEELDIKKSWTAAENRIAIEEYQHYFEELFLKTADFVDYLSFEAIETAIKNDFGNQNIQELLINEQQLIAKKKGITRNRGRKKLLENLETDMRKLLNKPAFPFPQGPRAYQQEAYDKWVANGHKGIFAMATGTGKTITSLNCLLNLYHQTQTYKALIIVPTIALVNQWKNECEKFNFSNVICVSSKTKWTEDLAFFNTANKFTDTSFIIIVTYASFPRPKFQSYFKQLPFGTLFVADEMHNLGSPRVLASLEHVHLHQRIGLSATPNRKYDEIGNTAIQQFFEDKPPYTFSYSMEQAIKNKPFALCSYTYYPHIVHLNESELAEYIKRSKQLLRYFDFETGQYKDCKEVEILLLERKRIIHKAQNKKAAFEEIVKSEFKKRGHLKYTLVYVPEGVDVDYSTRDEYIETAEDTKLINLYTKIISRTDFSIMVKQYTAKTKNREAVLEKFSRGEIDVLCSMKCLEEGVDVPRSELAIFCASTGNPRQFIQRRGRVLRLHKDKNFATIHDLVVIPYSRSAETFEMERGILKKELERVVDFSRLSLNKMDTYTVLKEALDYYNLNLNDF